MMHRRFPVARVTALVAVAVGLFMVSRDAGRPHWRALRPGVEFGTLRGEPWCRGGSAAIAALRLDPARVRIRVHHYRRERVTHPPDIVAWQKRTGALAVFNAGQFYPDFSYMGLLVSDGEVVSRRVHPTFRAALVAGPSDGSRRARVVDLQREPLDPDSLHWDEVAQSFMLFDRSGMVRVRRSDQIANRTVVAEDRAGRLVVLTSEGAYTLWDLAHLLQAAPLQLAHAMAMDGGREAELVVSAGRFRYATFGQWDGARGADPEGRRVPLPAVVTVSAP